MLLTRPMLEPFMFILYYALQASLGFLVYAPLLPRLSPRLSHPILRLTPVITGGVGRIPRVYGGLGVTLSRRDCIRAPLDSPCLPLSHRHLHLSPSITYGTRVLNWSYIPSAVSSSNWIDDENVWIRL